MSYVRGLLIMCVMGFAGYALWDMWFMGNGLFGSQDMGYGLSGFWLMRVMCYVGYGLCER